MEANSQIGTYSTSMELVADVDVVVAGGGTAGMAAAVAAARNGARTMLVERFGYLGGNLTAGLVGPCMTSYSLDGKTQLVRGIFDEFVQRMVDRGEAIHPRDALAGSPYTGFQVFGHDAVTPFEPEAAKIAAQEMCVEAGVELLLHTFVLDAHLRDGSVAGIVVTNKSGVGLIRASTVIDCTADADVASRAGAEMLLGRDEDGLTQPMSMFFRVEGVDDDTVQKYAETHPDEITLFGAIIDQARQEGTWPSPRRGVGLFRGLHPGVWRVNATRVQGVGTDARALTAAELEGRDQTFALVEFFRTHFPGFERVRLLDTAAMTGVRETRRIVGDYVLTLEDLQQGRIFDDVIALCGYPVDIHDPKGAEGGMSDRYGTANVYSIPYRSLLPQGIDGLLVAGRCVSATHEALSAIRVMPPAFAMGEAAGVAAAMSALGGGTPRTVDVDHLQHTLTEQGAYLGDPDTVGPRVPVQTSSRRS